MQPLNLSRVTKLLPLIIINQFTQTTTKKPVIELFLFSQGTSLAKHKKSNKSHKLYFSEKKKKKKSI